MECEGDIAAGTAHPPLFVPPVPSGDAGAREAAGAICGMARAVGDASPAPGSAQTLSRMESQNG